MEKLTKMSGKLRNQEVLMMVGDGGVVWLSIFSEAESRRNVRILRIEIETFISW